MATRPEAVATGVWWQGLLEGLGESHMDPVAYDTAWVARLLATGAGVEDGAAEAWDWLLGHQHGDGSWGAQTFVLPDRLAATAAALVALSDVGRTGMRPPCPEACAAAIRFLRVHLPRLAETSPSVETVGFELCLPPLLDEARALGVDLPDPPEALLRRRREKLARLPAGWRLNPPPSLLHSLEGWAGQDLPRSLLGPTGACGNSPSATACHERLHPQSAARAYLRAARSGGGVRDVYPFEVFELAWVLDHLALAGVSLRTPSLQPYVSRLRAAWRDGAGVGIAAEGLEPDADDTALTALGLARAGRAVALDPLRAFERTEGFACFPFERNPSVSANIHVGYVFVHLSGARAVAGLGKVLAFLADRLSPDGYWTDKWHVSPYYPTARAVVALHRVAPTLLARPLNWLRASQHADGSWGVGGGSPEETAYAVQALCAVGPPDARVLARAAGYLRACPARPALWIGKGLYCPRRVVDAAILSARALVGGWSR